MSSQIPDAQKNHVIQNKSEGLESSEGGQSLSPPEFSLTAGPIQAKGADAGDSGPGGGDSSGSKGDVMAKMESGFGEDFSDVNIHTDSSKASDVGALAYAQGNDVHFAAGQFKPDTQKGQELIGHEMAHVVQQRKGQVKPTTEVGGMAVNDDPALENEADEMGAKVAQGKFADGGSGSGGGSGAGNVIQKYDESETEYSYRGNTMDQEAQAEYQAGQQGDMTDRATRDLAQPLTVSSYNTEVSDLQVNVDAVYTRMTAGFRTQMAAFLEAENNMKGVLDAVSKRQQATAAMISVFLGVVTGIAGGLVTGMLTNVIGRTVGPRAASMLGTTAANMNGALAGGVIDGVKGLIGLAAGPSAVPDTSGMDAAPGFSDANSVRENGLTVIAGEQAAFASLIQALTNRREEAISNNVRPASLLARMAPELAAKQTAGQAAQAGSNTKTIEKALWESWIGANGMHITPAHVGACVIRGETRTFSVDKYILEHLKDDLNVSEATARRWAGF